MHTVFSIEWARIEPAKGTYDEKEMEHYRNVLKYCYKKCIKPIVTMHHFSSPKWLISQGGWENEATIQAFANYCSYVVCKLGCLLEYVCTINEANIGLQLAAIIRDYRKQMNSNAQLGTNVDLINPTFLSPRSEAGDKLIMRAHEAARDAMKAINPDLKVGVTLSLHDFQTIEGGEEIAAELWEQEFLHYIPYIKNDDFLGGAELYPKSRRT